MDIMEMSRAELVRIVTENKDTLDIEVLKQALDRIDAMDGVDKTEVESAIADINDEAFEALPVGKQLEKLMKASQALIDEVKKSGINV